MTREDVERDIRAILAQAAFRSDTEATWRGEPVPARGSPSPGFLVREGDPTLVALLAQRIYEGHYVRPDDIALQATSDRLVWTDYIAKLQSLTATKVSWSSGWKLREKGERWTLARGADVIEADPADVKEDGGAHRVKVPGTIGGVQPGWFHARGELEYPQASTGTARVYWNVCRAGAGALLSTLTRSFNEAQIPFHFKIADDPARYFRADAGVLYVARADWPRIAPVLSDVHARVAPYLKSATPAFAKRLAPGLSVAESPPDPKVSFGTSRCSLVAEGLWNAHRQGVQDPDGRRDAVVARFAQAGIDVKTPWLEGTHEDPYDVRILGGIAA